MHLATDCFAFDESIHAGIFNVTAGILHGLSVIAPELQHSLIVRRPNLPPAQADWASEHGAATVLNESQADAELRENVSRFGYSHRPSFQLILNGRHLEPVTSGPDWLEWEVNEPAVRLAIASRSWIPAEILPGSSDNRELGTGVTAITLSGPFAVTSIDLDRDLGEGWYHPEPNLRWTGRTGAIPTALLAGHGLPVRIRICYLPDTYPRSRDDARNEQHVRAFRKAATTVLDDISAAGLSKRLACATAFHSHHFGPRIMPGMLNIATCYDMLPILRPSFFGADAVTHFDAFTAVMRRCDRVLAISEQSRADTIECLGIAPDRVVTAHISCDGRFRPVPKHDCRDTLLAYSLVRPYVICVGTLEPRKNQLRVLRAWEALQAEHILTDLDIVFVGKRGWGVDAFFSAVAASPYRAHIHLLHDVSTTTLVHLYNGALVSLYVSEYEGFGVPLLESMSCGVPVITSDSSSMREVGSGAAYLVDPLSVEQIAVAIGVVAQDENLRTRLSIAGFNRRREYSWEACAERYLEVLREGRA